MSIIVGLKYYDFYNVGLKQGDSLILEREPDNQYDKNAIVAFTEGKKNKIGYVRKEDNKDTQPGLYKITVYGPDIERSYLEVTEIENTCIECKSVLVEDWKAEYCCNSFQCGCYGMPINKDICVCQDCLEKLPKYSKKQNEILENLAIEELKKTKNVQIEEVDAKVYCTSCQEEEINKLCFIEKFTSKLIVCEKCLLNDNSEYDDSINYEYETCKEIKSYTETYSEEDDNSEENEFDLPF